MPVALTEELIQKMKNHPFILLSPNRISERAYFHWLNRTGKTWWDPVANWLQSEKEEIEEQVHKFFVEVAINGPTDPQNPFHLIYRQICSYRLPLYGPQPNLLPLGTKEPRRCSLCGETDRRYFRKIAHALPELLGNHKLITHGECDKCNERYAREGENELGNMLLVDRAATGTPTKQTTAKMKIGKSGESRSSIGGQARGESLRIELVQDDDSIAVEGRDEHSLRLKIKNPSYAPMGAIRSIARSIWHVLPEELQTRYSALRTWITGATEVKPANVYRFFVPGGIPFVGIAVWERSEAAPSNRPELVGMIFSGTTILVWNLPDFSIGKHKDFVAVPMLPLSPYPPNQHTAWKIQAVDDRKLRPPSSHLNFFIGIEELVWRPKPTDIVISVRLADGELRSVQTSLVTPGPAPQDANTPREYHLSGREILGKITITGTVKTHQVSISFDVEWSHPAEKLLPMLELIDSLHRVSEVNIIEQSTNRKLLQFKQDQNLVTTESTKQLEWARMLASINNFYHVDFTPMEEYSDLDIKTLILILAAAEGRSLTEPLIYGQIPIAFTAEQATQLIKLLSAGPADLDVPLQNHFEVLGRRISIKAHTLTLQSAEFVDSLDLLEARVAESQAAGTKVQIKLRCAALVHSFNPPN